MVVWLPNDCLMTTPDIYMVIFGWFGDALVDFKLKYWLCINLTCCVFNQKAKAIKSTTSIRCMWSTWSMKSTMSIKSICSTQVTNLIRLMKSTRGLKKPYSNLCYYWISTCPSSDNMLKMCYKLFHFGSKKLTWRFGGIAKAHSNTFCHCQQDIYNIWNTKASIHRAQRWLPKRRQNGSEIGNQ